MVVVVVVVVGTAVRVGAGAASLRKLATTRSYRPDAARRCRSVTKHWRRTITVPQIWQSPPAWHTSHTAARLRCLCTEPATTPSLALAAALAD